MNHDDLIIAQYFCGRCNKNTHVLAQVNDKELLPSPLKASFGCLEHNAALMTVQPAGASVTTLDLVLARITPQLLKSMADSDMVETDVDTIHKEEQIERLYNDYKSKGIVTILLPVDAFNRFLQQTNK